MRDGRSRSRVVERRMQLAGVDHAPAVAEVVGVDAVDVEAALAVPLQDGDAVDVAFQQQVDGLAAELGGVEAVEEDRPAAALGVADFTSEDRGPGRFVAALAGEVAVAEPLDQDRAAAPRPRR